MGVADLFPATERPDTHAVDHATIRRPAGRDIHLRDGAMPKAVPQPETARFAHGIIVQTRVPPVTTVAAASACRGRIRAALPEG